VNLITIQFDGGCSPNPGHKYGSYCVSLNDKELIREQRFKLGFGTNNEAEFQSLERGLIRTTRELKAGGFDPGQFTLDVITDSDVVKCRLDPKSKRPKQCKANERALVMCDLAALCLKHMILFKSWTVIWMPRMTNVETFGH
jgi:ribonuclease HI